MEKLFIEVPVRAGTISSKGADAMVKKLLAMTAIVLCVALKMSVYAEAEGTLNVKTDPDGIEVWLDDKYIGDSPVIDKKLKAGKYSLKLVDPIQHTSSIEEVFIQANEQTVVEKTMKSRFGSLKINSDPDGADVSILTSLGKTPLSNDFIIPGKYRLEITRQGCKPTVADIVVPKGEVASVQKTLEKKNVLDTKGVVKILLGAGAVGGIVCALVESNDPHFPHDYSNGAHVGCILAGCLAGAFVITLDIASFY
jgi:PEGA domain